VTLGDWTAADGNGGGWLAAVDLLVFIRLLIFYWHIFVPQQYLVVCNFWISKTVHWLAPPKKIDCPTYRDTWESSVDFLWDTTNK
jgi:hypothetical protein